MILDLLAIVETVEGRLHKDHHDMDLDFLAMLQ